MDENIGEKQRAAVTVDRTSLQPLALSICFEAYDVSEFICKSLALLYTSEQNSAVFHPPPILPIYTFFCMLSRGFFFLKQTGVRCRRSPSSLSLP